MKDSKSKNHPLGAPSPPPEELKKQVEPLFSLAWQDPETLVEIDHPSPKPLGVILQEVAAWSGFNFVMDPALGCSIQIFAPHKVSKPEAFKIFLLGLEAVHLHVIQMDKKTLKIVRKAKIPIQA